MAPGFFFILTKILIYMLRFLFYTVIAYFIFRWLDGLFKAGKQSKRHTTTSRRTKSTFSKDVGEYVDYEEVQDDEK